MRKLIFTFSVNVKYKLDFNCYLLDLEISLSADWWISSLLIEAEPNLTKETKKKLKKTNYLITLKNLKV